MKKRFLRLTALALALICLIPSALAESLPLETQNTEETQYVVMDGPSANNDLAFGSVCILNGCRTMDGYVALAGSDRRLDTAQAAFAFERNTGTLVYSYNPDAKVSLGGLAKMVTTLLALEYCQMDEVLTVANNKRFPTGQQHVSLKNEEQLTVEDLVHCVMLANASDASIVLAERVAGNSESFVTMMNARVRQMGCTSTNFTNVYGGDSGQAFTTARDMARITSECIRNEQFRDLFCATTYTVPATNRSDERVLQSTNYFVYSKNITKFYDSRVTGGMQSASNGTGASLTWTASYRNMDMIFVVLGCTRQYYENGWQVKVYGNFEEGQSLMNYVFDNFKANRVLYNGQALKQFSVSGGESNVVAEPHLDLDSVLPNDVQMDNLIMEYNDKGLTAPIQKGDMVATVELWYRNTCLHEAELYAMNEVRTTSDSGLKVLGGADRSNSESRFSRFALIVCLVILVPAVGYLAINSYLRARRRARIRRRRGNQGRRNP